MQCVSNCKVLGSALAFRCLRGEDLYLVHMPLNHRTTSLGHVRKRVLDLKRLASGTSDSQSCSYAKLRAQNRGMFSEGTEHSY